MNSSECLCGSEASSPATDIFQTTVLTVIVASTFVVIKSAYDEFRQIMSHVTVVIVGGGPIGLLSLLIAAKCGRVSRIIFYEERSRFSLLTTGYQINLDAKSVTFLTSLGIDFDNIEGCWEKGCFFTRAGVFLEYLLSYIHRLDIPIELKLNTKFNKECLKELDTIFGRLVAVVCDGAAGKAGPWLGLSDEFTTQSCRSYGAFALLEQNNQPLVPAAEIRVHNLHFNLMAYDNDCSFPQGFHLKIFGSLRHRCLALAVPRPRGESKVVKLLKVVLDQSVMRSIFSVCFNTYRSDCENDITDEEAVKFMKFSPRLFEIKLSQRMEGVAYVQDANVFVVAEGDSARRSNFHTGMNINLGVRGLTSLSRFLQMAASAETDHSILQALHYKYNHSRIIAQEFIKNGLKDTMYT